MTGIFWLFTMLFAYGVGRTTEGFDWRSFWAIMGMSGASYALVAAIWWASAVSGRDYPRDD